MVLCLTNTSGQNVSLSNLPVQLVFVPHPQANSLTKHPVLPVLYLGLQYAADSKNLVTFRLDESGQVLANSQRNFDDYFGANGKNSTNPYRILRPLVLREEKVLLLAAQPRRSGLAQHLAAVALDEEGQPVKLIEALRTTHTEPSIVTTAYEETTRRLYLSYSTYWGWILVGKDGVPLRDFHLLKRPGNLWAMAAIPEWGRIIGVAAGTALCNLRVDLEGKNVEFIQLNIGPTPAFGAFGAFQLSPMLRKLYLVNGPDLNTISVYSFSKDGRLTSVPRRFTVGDSHLLCLDSTARRLYSFTRDGTIRLHHLDEEGFPTVPPEVFHADCGSIQDVIADQTKGTIYVACTKLPPIPH